VENLRDILGRLVHNCEFKFSGSLKSVSTIVVVGVATPCGLPCLLQLLEETCCLFSKVFIDLRETRSYNLRFKYTHSRIFVWSQNKYKHKN
jgi:hypothetical protein